MIDDKLIQKMVEGLKYALDGLEKIQAGNEKPKVEPQAGDVWATDHETVLIHHVSTGLGFTYKSGYRGVRPLSALLAEYPFKRIFSLKEAKDE